jgi:hypothetical protein
MRIESAIACVTDWLDVIHVESAAQRVEQAQQQYLAREASFETSIPRNGDFAGAVALHEAAHAVVACRLGLHVSCVRINSDQTGAARYQCEEEHSFTGALNSVTTGLAGLFVELLADQADTTREFQLAHSHDILKARLGIEECRQLAPWDMPTRIFAEIGACCVASNLEEIRRVAAALGELGQLDGETVAAFCGVMQ